MPVWHVSVTVWSRRNQLVDAEALAETKALIADLDCLSKEAPDAKRHAGNFEPAKAVKSVSLDPSDDAGKKVRIGSELDPK